MRFPLIFEPMRDARKQWSWLGAHYVEYPHINPKPPLLHVS